MALNTLHNVKLTEGQIGVILCSLEKSVKYADSEYIELVDEIMQVIEENSWTHQTLGNKELTKRLILS